MLKIGITGQAGFIGTHLFNYLGLQDGIERVQFKKDFFQDQKLLGNFVKQCDVIIHLAAMNRHNDPDVIYQANITLVQHLINAMESEDVKPHVIFSSSTQEEKDNIYGKSKKEGRNLFIKWADILLESGMFGDLSASISIIVQIEVLSIWPVHSL